MNSQITLQSNQSSDTFNSTDTFCGTGDIVLGIPPYQNLKQPQQPKQTSLTVEQIISLTEEQIKEDIFKGTKCSKIIDAYRQIETTIHNDKSKNKFNNFILNVDTLSKIGIYTTVNYSENEYRSFINIIPYEVDMDELMKYFVSKLGCECTC